MTSNIPTTDQLRGAWVKDVWERSGQLRAEGADAGFDEWLNRIRAEAWDAGEAAGAENQEYWDGWRDTKPPATNPYRDREEQ